MDIEIRKLQPDEWRLAKKLRLEALTNEPTAFSRSVAETEAMPEAKWRGRLEESLAEQTSYTLYALAAGEPVGTMTCYWEIGEKVGHVANLAGVYVTPEYRGQKVAQQLLDAILEFVRKRGFRKLKLTVTAGNERAVAFYKRNGFEKTGVFKEESAYNGEYYDEELMELFL
jgi:ribosomal protein S18 acetylase RimI-like enzyme